MQALLHLKAWQLFFLLFGMPIVLEAGVMTAVFTGQSVPWVLVGVLLAAFLALGGLLAWFYVLGSHLYRRLPPAAPMSLTRFRIAALVPVMYVFLLLAYGANTFRGGPTSSPPGGAIAVMVALHLLSMGCIFYCLYFTAKALKTVERNAPVPASEYLGEFFLLWFYPVGIWLLQPRINRLFAFSETAD